MRRIVDVAGTDRPGVSQVPLQGQRPGIEPVGGQLFTQPHDGGDDLVADRTGVAAWSSRSGIDGLQAALAIALEQSVQMLAREPVGLGCSGDAELTTDDMEDGNPRFRHEPRLSPMTRLIERRSRCNP
jgi:hypothetical protein